MQTAAPKRAGTASGGKTLGTSEVLPDRAAPAPPRHLVGSPAASVLAALVIAIIVTACGAIPVTTTPTIAVPASTQPPAPASLAIDATGLGPCREPWYTTCNYGIRVEGNGGYDHRGNFAWDEGRPPEGQMEHGPAGPVASTSIWGDVPSTLGLGAWTISFRLWYGSDAIVYEPVPGGTPRYQEEDPFTAACSTHIDTLGVLSVTLHVAFLGSACTVETQIAR